MYKKKENGDTDLEIFLYFYGEKENNMSAHELHLTVIDQIKCLNLNNTFDFKLLKSILGILTHSVYKKQRQRQQIIPQKPKK